jgi:hypothetical protein
MIRPGFSRVAVDQSDEPSPLTHEVIVGRRHTNLSRCTKKAKVLKLLFETIARMLVQKNSGMFNPVCTGFDVQHPVIPNSATERSNPSISHS